MKEPTRFTSGTGPARELMRGSALRVPSGARQRALQFTGTAVGLTASGTAAAAGTASLAKTLLLTVSLGAVGGGFASLAVSEAFRRFDAPPAATAKVAPVARRNGAGDTPSLVPTPAVVEVRPSDEAPAAATGELPVLPAPSAKKKQGAVVEAAPEPADASAARRPSLFEEQRVIETARAAVAQGDAAHALATLDAYDRSYTQKQFGPEALALRVQALRASGQEGRAQALAREFEQRYPHHPLLSRVQNR